MGIPSYAAKLSPSPVSNSARYVNKSAISLFVAFLQRVMA
jgi:hypothetical protein